MDIVIMLIVFNLIIFITLLILIRLLARRFDKLSLLVALGLAGGVLFGIFLQLSYGPKSDIVKETLRWMNIVGSGYVSLLQMIIMPLIVTSILGAVAKVSSFSVLGKVGGSIIAVLLITVGFSAFIGIFVVDIFDLDAEGLIDSSASLANNNSFAPKVEQLSQFHPADFVVSMIPKNPFWALTGQESTSVIGVVIFSVFLALGALLLKKDDPEKASLLERGIDIMQAWVIRLTRIVIRLAPYGSCALVAAVASSSQLAEISKLADFLILSYLAIFLVFFIHGILLWCFAINPFLFFKKVMPVLIFAFTSRSSSASIPMSINIQVESLKIRPVIASLAASLGSTIGQNGCAGIYPAMLASMTAPVLGIDIGSFQWFAMLIFIVMISSIGVAGVGGGATFAALIVLPNLGLPLTLVVLLIAIEPLIDMGRTALNVNGALVAGTLVNKLLGKKIETQAITTKS